MREFILNWQKESLPSVLNILGLDKETLSKERTAELTRHLTLAFIHSSCALNAQIRSKILHTLGGYHHNYEVLEIIGDSTLQLGLSILLSHLSPPVHPNVPLCPCSCNGPDLQTNGIQGICRKSCQQPEAEFGSRDELHCLCQGDGPSEFSNDGPGNRSF